LDRLFSVQKTSPNIQRRPTRVDNTADNQRSGSRTQLWSWDRSRPEFCGRCLGTCGPGFGLERLDLAVFETDQ